MLSKDFGSDQEKAKLFLEGLCLFTHSAFSVVNPYVEIINKAKPSANKITFEDDKKKV